MSTQASFQLGAEFPHGALPEVFGVLTVADPADLRGEQGLPGSILGDALRIKKWRHYSAEVVPPGVTEPLVSFAIIENLWVPGRDLPKTIDAVFKTPSDENRLLILSPFPYGKPSRPTKESCSLRNHFILSRAAERFIPHAAGGSSLAADLENHLL